MEIKYIIYNPAGNITALVIGDEYKLEEKKIINDKIMEINPDVEQVGFISTKETKLTMAGGEFCGNATRCAALYYMNEEKDVKISINEQLIKCEIINNKVACEIPIEEYEISKLEDEIYKIKLKDITIITVKNNYNIVMKNEEMKKYAQTLINLYNVEDKAVGIMLYYNDKEKIKLYPIVWVKEINTLFFENSCGSGSIGVSIIESLIYKEKNIFNIIQPSNEVLETEIQINSDKKIKANLKGEIFTDNIIRTVICNLN